MAEATIIPVTYVNATTCTIENNVTAYFQVRRRIKFLKGSIRIYGTITSSVFTDVTTIQVSLDGGQTLDATVTGCWLGEVSPTNSSVFTASTSVAGFMSATDKTKLDGIETGATGDMTATEILTAVKTVDGASSGLDSDLLDGQEGSYYSGLVTTHASSGDHDTRYYTETELDAGQLDNRYYTESEITSLLSGKEDAFSKNTAFNKDFGTITGTVCQGDDSRLSDARTPTSHNNTYHSETYITAAGVTYENLNTNLDVGTGADQVAQGDHGHLTTITGTTTIVANGNGGTNDNVDVSNVGTIIANTAGGNVILGGLTGGVLGQKIIIVKSNVKNILIIEDSEGVGSQNINTARDTDIYVAPWGGAVIEFDGTSWQVVSSTSTGKIFYIDHTNADQGAASSVGKGLTVYDVAQLMTTDDVFTLVFEDHGAEYNFNTSIDLSTFEKATFFFEPGAIFTHNTDETVTFFSPVQLDFMPRQTLGDISIFNFQNFTVEYGETEVFPWVSADISNVRSPCGLWIDVSSSTTNGLQEGINCAFGDGSLGSAKFNLIIHGQQLPTGGPVVFNCTSTISVPAIRQAVWTTGGMTITTTASPALQFDSLFGCQFSLNVEIDTNNSAGPIVLFQPVNIPPQGGSGQVGIINSDIFINIVASPVDRPSGAANAIVTFDGTNGYISGNTLKFNEINGLGFANTIGISFININYNSIYNTIIAPNIHGVTTSMIQIGDGTSDMDHFVSNEFNIGGYPHSLSTGIGVDCYARKSKINIYNLFTNPSISFATDIYLRSTAENNIIEVPTYNTLTDNSDGSNRIITSTTDNKINYSNLNTNGSVGTGSTQVAQGDHTHAQLHDRSHAITGTSDHTATAYRTFYSDVSGNVQELAHGTANYVLTSNGPTAAPSWQVSAGGSSDHSLLSNLSYAASGHTGFAPSPHGNSDHSVTFITATDITYENLNSNGDVGTGSTQVAQGDHIHDGRYYTETELDAGQLDNRYYTETEITSLLSGKEDTFSKNTAFNKDFGTITGTVCQGDDSRLSDARTPTSHNNTYHSETYITAAGVTYENLNTNLDVGTGADQVAQGDHVHDTRYYTETELDAGQLDNRYYTETEITSLLSGKEDAFSKNTAFNKNFGSTTGTVCQGDDSRLSDARTPVSHNNTYHSETYITAAGVTYENLDANGDVGTGVGQLAIGNHTHAQLHDRSHTITSTSDHTATAYRTFYSDVSGNVQELAHGTATYVLTSNGPTAAPSWQASAGGAPISGGTDNAIVRCNGTSALQDSGIFIDDTDNITGVVALTMSDNLSLNADNKNIQVGASQDLKLYHDGTNSHINNATGYVILDLPANKAFHVGGSGTTSFGVESSDGQAGFYVNNDTSQWDVYMSSGSSDMRWYNGGDRMTLTSGGNLTITGNISKAGGSFKIDHPLYPETKWLYHSFVESPEMLNIYTGVVTCGANGRAIVQLPSYFQALNKNYTYQLTCIGGYANVYIYSEISNNTFEISGAKDLKVSWMVTGVRQDTWANNNRIIPEVDKDASVSQFQQTNLGDK